MASCFAIVSKDEILAVNEASAPTDTLKRYLLVVYWSIKTKFLLNCNKIIKIIPETLSIET